MKEIQEYSRKRTIEMNGPLADSGLQALCAIARFYRVPADAAQLRKGLALDETPATDRDIVRAAKMVGLKARIVTKVDMARLAAAPTPAIVRSRAGAYLVFAGRLPNGLYRIVDSINRLDRMATLEEVADFIDPFLILVARRAFGAGVDPTLTGYRWVLPSIVRYKRPLAQVMLGSLFIQIFALIYPIFFQVVVDKVLTHRSYPTLLVLTAGIVIISAFDVILQYLRTYALSHTTSRIDVELGMRLYRHLLRLPISYFETRAAGQTVARVRELETIRSFLTGQALFSALDLIFAFVLIGMLFVYSWRLTLISLATIPCYVLIAISVRPLLRDAVNEKFNRGAESQQFLVESVIGISTLKASAVEPMMASQWEDRLAAYVKTAFNAILIGARGQGAVQFVNRIANAALLLFGAQAVIEQQMTVGELVAFNMIANQVAQPVLRLSQLWQDFQQSYVSVERLGDILNAQPEPASQSAVAMPPPKGAITLKNVTFRYRPGVAPSLTDVSLDIKPGEVIGIVGASGSGKSTLAKMIQRFYVPESGQILLDGVDTANLDPAWLRPNIGVVLQENVLFNRSVHDNIALASPAMPRPQVIAIARLAGADEFIVKMSNGYDTIIEERGANLSGGQRQRLAIARALAVNPPILIFDEATSALDYESERVIQSNMREIVRNRTVIIIAHRLAAVRTCSRIVGMSEGRIVEVGAHDELLAHPDGVYARLWALQTQRDGP